MKTVGTLKELGVGVGDVVEHSDGTRYEIRMNDCGNPANYDIKFGFFGVEVSESVQQYIIISRASDKTKLWRDMTAEEKGALLLAVHDGGQLQYKHNLDWQNCNDVFSGNYAYRIKPDPKVETVTITGGDGSGFGFYQNGGVNNTHRITFNLIDGKPDCASVKMEEL